MEISKNKHFFIKSKTDQQMTKAEIFKGLTSKEIKEKVQALKTLLVQIVNDPF